MKFIAGVHELSLSRKKRARKARSANIWSRQVLAMNNDPHRDAFNKCTTNIPKTSAGLFTPVIYWPIWIP